MTQDDSALFVPFVLFCSPVRGFATKEWLAKLRALKAAARDQYESADAPRRERTYGLVNMNTKSQDETNSVRILQKCKAGNFGYRSNC